MVNNLPAMQETWVQTLGWEDPLQKGMETHFGILAWRIHGQRSLVGYSPLGHKESDTTERLTLSLFNKRYVITSFMTLLCFLNFLSQFPSL